MTLFLLFAPIETIWVFNEDYEMGIKHFLLHFCYKISNYSILLVFDISIFFDYYDLIECLEFDMKVVWNDS